MAITGSRGGDAGGIYIVSSFAPVYISNIAISGINAASVGGIYLNYMYYPVLISNIMIDNVLNCITGGLYLDTFFDTVVISEFTAGTVYGSEYGGIQALSGVGAGSLLIDGFTLFDVFDAPYGGLRLTGIAIPVIVDHVTISNLWSTIGIVAFQLLDVSFENVHIYEIDSAVAGILTFWINNTLSFTNIAIRDVTNSIYGGMYCTAANGSLSLTNFSVLHSYGTTTGGVYFGATISDFVINEFNAIDVNTSSFGAIFCKSCFTPINIINSTFVGCNNPSGFGGAITYMGQTQDIGINTKGTTFSNCKSLIGGAIYLGHPIGHSYFSDCKFIGNVGSKEGGGVLVDGGYIDVTDSLFDGNAADSGGGIGECKKKKDTITHRTGRKIHIYVCVYMHIYS
ncbi:polymorphic outer membrane protein [Reticulomyxa filosa]|uniref:Polymorphic outer membrane protein n=1 Tax=Reticulomyxa filosa TaxID=46433 RepID=X6NUP1_RETFI|nr:polymorphic outer membrane protein [Reticulomyxa filosa]|eukprot:ETO30020.1 polymorphic outer membrane protein [Reticulomyxa filosa]